MSTIATPDQPQVQGLELEVQQKIESIIDQMIASLPDANKLTSAERRGIIARYSSVLESNFIYWMTATLMAATATEVAPILLDNLLEEVRDAHPNMLRKFAIAANAFPNAVDALAVNEELMDVRIFLGRLNGVQSLVTMGFFEGFIQKFMPFLASLAAAEGSTEMEYTDVHGVCDIEHTAGLFRALGLEMAAKPAEPGTDMFEGVNLLRTLIERTIDPKTVSAAA